MSRTATGESSLARAVRILAAFTPDEPTLGVAEIARRAGLHVATASRLIAELVKQGLLERGSEGEVRVGVRMWELASRASPTLSLRDAAMPYLEDLHAVVGHHAQLSVLDAGDVLVVERLSARDAVVNYSRIAGRMPLHVSSSGHVFLAYGPAEARERALGRPLEAYTPQSITTVDGLRKAIAHVRRQGYALVAGQFHEDATGIAVPVRDGLNELVATISVVVPNDEHAKSNLPVLLAAARGVTRTLSGRHAGGAR